MAMCYSEADFRDELKRMQLPSEKWPTFLTTEHADATTHKFIAPKGHKPCAIVCLGRTKGVSLEQVHGLLVHEAVHIWQWIRERIGEDSPSSEFEAYSIQAIAQEMMLSYANHRKRKK